MLCLGQKGVMLFGFGLGVGRGRCDTAEVLLCEPRNAVGGGYENTGTGLVSLLTEPEVGFLLTGLGVTISAL